MMDIVFEPNLPNMQQRLRFPIPTSQMFSFTFGLWGSRSETRRCQFLRGFPYQKRRKTISFLVHRRKRYSDGQFQRLGVQQERRKAAPILRFLIFRSAPSEALSTPDFGVNLADVFERKNGKITEGSSLPIATSCRHTILPRTTSRGKNALAGYVI